MSEDISFLVERLQHLIPTAIYDGIKDGLSTVRRPVLYHTYDLVPKENLKFGQAEGSYRWSEEEYKGTFVSFAHYDNEELEADMIVERPDGTITQVAISKVRFVES